MEENLSIDLIIAIIATFLYFSLIYLLALAADAVYSYWKKE